MSASPVDRTLFNVRAGRLPGTTAQQIYRLITSADGGAEVDPPVLLGAVLHCLEQTMRAYRVDPALRGRLIVGIGVSCFWHSLLGCDARGSGLGLAIARRILELHGRGIEVASGATGSTFRFTLPAA